MNGSTRDRTASVHYTVHTFAEVADISLTPHLVDATLFYTPTSGGVRRYLDAKHAWLRAHGRVRHTLFVPGAVDRGHAGGRIEFASPLLRAGYRCPVRLRALRAALTDLGPDLIEAGDPYLMAWQVAAVADANGIPSVAFCHSDVIDLVRQRAGAIAGAATAAYLRALYGHFDLIFAPSRLVADRLAAAGLPGAIVQPLGVDPAVFRPDAGDGRLRASLGLPPDSRLLVFAGRLAPEKNVGELQTMVAMLGSPYHLIIVGGERAARPEPRVTILPYARDTAELAGILAQCDALVHAGRQETFGLVALEAMACGLPVACYDAGGLPEVVDASVGAVADATGPASLAAATTSIFDREPRALRAAARRRVLNTYTWDAAFRAQLGHYARLLSRGSLLEDAAPLSAAPQR